MRQNREHHYPSLLTLNLPSEQNEKNEVLEEVEKCVMQKGTGQNAPGLGIEQCPSDDIQIFHDHLFIISACQAEDLNDCDRKRKD